VRAFHIEAIDRAVLHTNSTVHAGIWIYLPGFCSLIHGDALGRTFLLAHAAEDALFDIVEEISPHIGKRLTGLERIEPCMRLGEEVLDDGSRHVEHDILL
jgi:hypothetical protein